MSYEYTVLVHQLKSRLDDCYDKYIKGLLDTGAEELVELASEIVAVKEIYCEMRLWIELSMCEAAWPNGLFEEPIKEQEAAALLSLDNPLVELALRWWFHTLGNKADFHSFFYALHENECSQITAVEPTECEVCLS